jgi:transcriptional regulator with XRE-family HTH domain
MDMRSLVGKNVRRFREKRGLTQEQFAEISGFSQQYISGLERGYRNPTVVTLYEISIALDVSPLDLIRPNKANRPKP